MMYKNTFKLVLSNFHLVWKILAYMVIAGLVLLGLCYACSLPILKVLIEQGFSKKFIDLFGDFSRSFNIYQLFGNGVNLIDEFIEIILLNISNLWLYIVLFLFILVIGRAFLYGFYLFAATNVLYFYMGSNIKYGFTHSLFSTLKTNIKYQLCSLITILPIDCLFMVGLYFLLRFFVLSEGLLILAPVALFFVAILLFSFKITFFSGWLPAIMVFECGVWQGLKKGVKAVFRRFYRNFSTSVFVILTIIIINVICAVCTFGASIFVTIPLSSVVIVVYNMVMFYTSQGMRFYVDNEQVVTPKRLEETDGLGGLKYII